MKKTKLVCTLGPASESMDKVRAIIEAGMDVARLNFSHGSHEEHLRKLQNVKQVAEELNKPVAVLQDISGPKIRVGFIKDEPITLHKGAEFILSSEEVVGDAHKVSVSHKLIPSLVQEGDIILLADGLLQLKVVDHDDQNVITKVLVGGELRSHKGVNLPSRSIGIEVMNEKDKADLAFGLKSGVDVVALSFVRCAADALPARKIMKDMGREVPLIAKIEKPEAVKNIEEIINEFDGVMVARGDLGVELPFEQIPSLQKHIINLANKCGKPVITATQMLETMVEHPRPTRAEVSDIANAIFDGTDAIMLSEESAMGKYPIESASTMASIACQTELSFPYRFWTSKFKESDRPSSEEIIARNACEIAETIGVTGVFCVTETGRTARLISKYRPHVPVYAVTDKKKTLNSLCLTFGVVPLYSERSGTLTDVIKFVQRFMIANDISKAVFTGSPKVATAGSTDLILVMDSETFFF